MAEPFFLLHHDPVGVHGERRSRRRKAAPRDRAESELRHQVENHSRAPSALVSKVFGVGFQGPVIPFDYEHLLFWDQTTSGSLVRERGPVTVRRKRTPPPKLWDAMG